jgi:hypothetical protein
MKIKPASQEPLVGTILILPKGVGSSDIYFSAPRR